MYLSILIANYICICIFFLLQDVLILYARLQLNITRGATDGSILVHQLLDIVYKELDQSYISNANVPRWAFSFSFPLFFFLVIINFFFLHFLLWYS